MFRTPSIKAISLVTLALALAVALTPGQAAEKKKLTPKDSEKLRRVGSAALSPDGAWVSFTDSAGRGSSRRGGGRSTRPGADQATPKPVNKLVLQQVDGDARVEIKDGRGLKFSPSSPWVGWNEPRPQPKKPADDKKTASEKPAARPTGEGGKNSGKPAEKPKRSAGERRSIPERLRALRAQRSSAEKAKPGEEATKPTEKATEPGETRRGRGEGRRGSRSGGRGPRSARGSRGGRSRPASQETRTDRRAAAPRGRGDTLVLRNLSDARTLKIKDVSQWQFTKDGGHLLYIQTPKEEGAHGIYLLDLSADVTAQQARALVKGKGRYSNVSFEKTGRYLTFWSDHVHPDAPAKPKAAPAAKTPEKKPEAKPANAGEEASRPTASATKKSEPNSKPGTTKDDEKSKEPKEPTRLWQWDRETDKLHVVYGPESKGFPKDMDLVSGSVSWTKDRGTIYVRFRPKPKDDDKESETGKEEEGEKEVTLPNGRTVRVSPSAARRFASRSSSGPPRENDVEGEKKDDEARLDVWHWKDAKIATMRNRGSRGRRGGAQGGNAALLHRVDLSSGHLLAIGHERLSPSLNEARTWAYAADDDPYTAERTWDRSYSDYYLINARDGSRRRVLTHTAKRPTWSPNGDGLLFFNESERAWFVIDAATHRRTRLAADTSDLGHDSRGVPSSGRFGRAMPGDRALVWSDGKDLWAVPLDGSPPRNLTRTGRRDGITYAHLVLDSDQPYGADEQIMLLSSTNDRTKAEGLHRLNLSTLKMETLLCMDKDLGSPVKAKDAERYVISLTSSEHPSDLWLADADLGKLRRLTDANPWLKDYAIPQTELISWRNTDGDELQGILVKPVGYQPGKTYPTIVYMYEILSNGLHRFRTPGLQLNPQTWAQNGYAVFMPDITYQIGKPGMSSVRCVVPGVQKLIEMGVADPARVGLCGHSWGGYETAYIITQTKMFAAAVSGAPVVNMTSAYSGIRWSTGLPRQFQYERTQSRIGGSLWEYPERYIENSPVFHLEDVETPVLIMFGNRDGAVPWYQGIEYYLGMRRLGKQAVFLEYKDEDHGLRRKPNQQDYHDRIMAWWDHYLKGVKPADWIVGPKAVDRLGDTGPVVPATNGN